MCDSNSIQCPSNRCKPGSKLLGVRQDNGTVSILPDPLPIDEEFIDQVSQSPVTPEQRFRFTNKCVESGCSQWNGKGCGVIDQVIQYLEFIPKQKIFRSAPSGQNADGSCKGEERPVVSVHISLPTSPKQTNPPLLPLSDIESPRLPEGAEKCFSMSDN